MTTDLKTVPEIKAIADAMPRPGEKMIGNHVYLRSSGGSPSIYIFYYIRGARRRYRIGPVETHLDLNAIRTTRREVFEQVKNGVDPEAARKEANIPTFGEYAEVFMDRHLPTMKNKSSAAKWRGSLLNHCKPIWNLPVDAIERRHIFQVLDPIWKKVGVTAWEVRGRIQTILASAKARGLRKGDNPAAWDKDMEADLGKPPKRGSTRGPMASVRFEALPALIAELDSKKIATTRALIAIAMTCVRTQEFLGMRLSELDLDAEQPIWTIPNARFKKALPNNEDFVVPLAPQVVRVLKEQIAELGQWGAVDYLWPSWVKGSRGGGPQAPHISNATMLRYLQRGMGLKATVHGFRASFRTWADDQFGSEVAPKYSHYAIEFCLTHIPGSAVEQAYRRGTFYKARISIMRDWASYLMPPEAAANVLPFKREQAQ